MILIVPFVVFKEVFSNKPFRLAAIIYLLSFAAADLVIFVFVWFLIFYIGAQGFFDVLVIALVLGVAFLTMPLTVKIMRHYDKRTAYMGTMAIYAIVLLIMSQIPRGGQTFTCWWSGIFAGFGHGAANVIPLGYGCRCRRCGRTCQLVNVARGYIQAILF